MTTKTRAALAKHDEFTNTCGCVTWWRGTGKAAKFYLKPCKPGCTVDNPAIAHATGTLGIKAVRIVYDGGQGATVRGFRRVR